MDENQERTDNCLKLAEKIRNVIIPLKELNIINKNTMQKKGHYCTRKHMILNGGQNFIGEIMIITVAQNFMIEHMIPKKDLNHTSNSVKKRKQKRKG